MKKLLMVVLLIMFLAVPVMACECQMCPTADNGINLFQAPTDKDAITCPRVCGRSVGSVKYDVGCEYKSICYLKRKYVLHRLIQR